MKKSGMVGILLAGGLSRRFGSPKAFAEMNGKTFYEITYDILAKLCEHVIIVTRPELVEKFPENVRVIVDDERFFGCGPLAGIHAAMLEERANRYVVLPCDMPLITEAVVRKLIELHQSELTVTVADGRTQPLVSVWEHTMFKTIEKTLINKNYKMSAVFDQTTVQYIDAKELTSATDVFININTVADKEEARKWIQEQS